MSTYRKLFYHIVFGTKYCQPTLNEEIQPQVYKHIWGILRNKNCILYRINGIENHMHLIVDIHPSIALSELVKDIKLSSSKFIKSSFHTTFDGWQEGYGAFTFSSGELNRLIDYVKNQKEHHKKESFFDEYKRMLAENSIEFEERYFLQK